MSVSLFAPPIPILISLSSSPSKSESFLIAVMIASLRASALSWLLDSIAVLGSLIERVLSIPFLSLSVMFKSPSFTEKAPEGTTEPLVVEPKYIREDSPVSFELIISW